MFYFLKKILTQGVWSKGEKRAGIEIFPNGDQYEGEYLEGKFHGKGCLHNKSMQSGKAKPGVAFEEKVSSGAKGSAEGAQQKSKGYRYEGDFVAGLRHGHGIEEYPDGSRYEGEFRNNLKHGKGVLRFSDGSYYEGDFVRGVPYGFGVHVAYSQLKSLSIMPGNEREN